MQGLAAAMGVTEHVTSPTFVVAQTYQGRLRLHHLDAYRIENSAQALDLDLPGLLSDDAVTAIEWGEVLLPQLEEEDFLRINLSFSNVEESGTVRLLEFDPVGPSWSNSRIAALAEAFKNIPIGL